MNLKLAAAITSASAETRMQLPAQLTGRKDEIGVIAHTLVEYAFDRHARVGAAQDDGKRLLAGQQFLEGRRHVRFGHLAHHAPAGLFHHSPVVGEDGTEVSDDAGFVVTGASPVETAAVFHRLEWVGSVPFDRRPRWLDIVVRVEEHRRCPCGGRQFTEHRRVGAGQLEQSDIPHPDAAKEVGRGFGRTMHLIGVVARSADRPDPYQVLEGLP